MTPIDLEYTTETHARTGQTLIAGNALMTPHPMLTLEGAVRYTVTDEGEGGRLLGYLEIMPRAGSGVSLKRVSAALDKLLEPRTVQG